MEKDQKPMSILARWFLKILTRFLLVNLAKGWRDYKSLKLEMKRGTLQQTQRKFRELYDIV